MVVKVSIPTPAPLWLCNPKTGPPASHSLPDTHHTAREGWVVDHPTLSQSIGAEEIPSPKWFPGEPWLQRSEEGRNSCPSCGSSELCCVIWNTPRSAMWSHAGALPMSCPLIEEYGLLNLEILDVAEKDPMTPAPASAASSPPPDPEEEEQVVLIPEESWTFEPEEAVPLEGGLHLVWGRYPTRPSGFAHSQANQTHAGLVRGIPLGAQLDFHSLGSLQIAISHGPAARDVHYEYQSWVITQASLQLPPFKPSKPSDSPPRIQELWANTMLFPLLMSNSSAP